MDIIGEAESSYEALELIDKEQPDIVFTDIYMPILDGIELSKIISEKYPQIKIIVLTGHDEFEYAKKGIKIGIADFLLKPIDDEQIVKSVERIKEKILVERKHNAENLMLKIQLEENLPFLKEKFLNELLNSSISLEVVEKKFEFFNLGKINKIFQVVLIELEYANKNSDIDINSIEEQKCLLNMQGYNIVSKCFKNDSNIHIFYDNSQRITILNNNKEIEINDCCEIIKTNVINQLKCYITIGIGNHYADLKDINISYKEAIDAVRYKIVVGKNQIINHSDISVSKVKANYFDNQVLDSLSFYIRVCMKKEAIETIEQLYKNLTLSYFNNSNHIKVIGANVISLILNIITELDISTEKIFNKNIQPYQNIFKLNTIPDIKEYLKELIFCTIKVIKQLNTNKEYQLIKEVKEYLFSNFHKYQLSLAKTAKQFYVNPSYLSRVFKQEVGENFVEYITKLRMEKAIEYFRETNLMAYEIAEKIGFSDPHYFSICFKKYTGYTVTQFKKLNS